MSCQPCFVICLENSPKGEISFVLFFCIFIELKELNQNTAYFDFPFICIFQMLKSHVWIFPNLSLPEKVLDKKIKIITDRGRKPNYHFHKIITLFLHESKSIALIFIILVIYFRSCRCTWQLKISWYTLCHAVFNFFFVF